MIGVVLLLVFYLNQVSSLDCGKTYFTGNFGTINTFSYNTSRTSCTYRIKTTSSRRLKLTWRKFDVDGNMPLCTGDSVTIKIGCSYQKTIAEFCSKNMKTLPHDIYSPDNCITITHTKYKTGGFIADYSSVSETEMVESSCYRNTYITRMPATIVSPGWPRQTRISSCEWKIRLNDKGQRIVINIMDMNGYSYRSTGYLCPYNDYLRIKGKKSMTTKSQRSWYFCRKPSSTTTYTHSTASKYYEMDIKLAVSKQYLSYPGRGFIIGIVAYEDELAKSLSSWTSIIVGVATVLIVFMLVICCYRRYRRRRLLENQPMLVPGTILQTGQPVQPSPAGYPTQQYAVPPSAYPIDQPPPYQPPPYDPAKGAEYTPYPSHPPPPGGAPPPGYPTYPQQNPAAAPYPQQNPGAALYPQQNPGAAPYPQQNPGYPSAYPPQYPPQ